MGESAIICETKESAAEIKELATCIYKKRFFLNTKLNQKLGERIIFLCPFKEEKERKAISFVGLQENKRLVVFTLEEDSSSEEDYFFPQDKVSFDLDEYIKKSLHQDAFVAMDVLSMVKETYWVGAYKDFINIYIAFYQKRSGFNPLEKSLVQIPADTIPMGNEGNSGIETCIGLIRTNDLNLNAGITRDDVEFIYIWEEESRYCLILKKTGSRKEEALLRNTDIINHKILSVYSTPNNIYLSSENERIYEIDYSGRICKKFHPRIHAVARSITVFSDYLYAALTSREICRIDLNKQPDDPSTYSFYTLFSSPVSIHLWGENLVVTTREPELIVFKPIPIPNAKDDNAKDDEEKIYDEILKERIGSEKMDVVEYCQNIMNHFKDNPWEESEIASLECAAYKLSKMDNKHIPESLARLVHCINSHFPEKGAIIINFISRFLSQIKERKGLSTLLKEFYLTSRDQYRSELLMLLDSKNELDYFKRNDSGTQIEEILNRLALFWCMTNQFYLEYVKPFTQPVPARDVYSFIKILDLGQNFQHVAVEMWDVKAKDEKIYILDNNDFEKQELPEKAIIVGGEDVLFRDMDVPRGKRVPEKHYLYIADEKSGLNVIEMKPGEDIRGPHIHRIKMKDMCWTVKVHTDGVSQHNLIVIGFKNRGLGVYLSDCSKGDQFLAQQEDDLAGEWIREADIRQIDDHNYRIVAAGSRRKKVYKFNITILDEAGKTDLKLEKSGEKAFTDSLFCIRSCRDFNKKTSSGIMAGSERGVLYFMDEALNLKWVYKLGDTIQGIRLFQSDSNKTEIAVCVQSGEVVFFSLEGMITRQIQFGKPVFAIDCGKLNVSKSKEHLICSVANRLIVYEENREKIKKEIENLSGQKIPDISEICHTLKKEYGKSDSLLPALCDTIEKYYQCQNEGRFIDELANNKTELGAFFIKHGEWAIPRLGRLVEEMGNDNWEKAEGIFEDLFNQICQTDDKTQADGKTIQQMDKESILWLYLRYRQKVFKDFKQNYDHTSFYRWLKKWLNGGQHPKWLSMATATMVADVLQIDTSNVLKQINELLKYKMQAELFTCLGNHFNHIPALDGLFQRYAELEDKDENKSFQKKFLEFVKWLEESKKELFAGIIYFNELLRFYTLIREALKADNIQKIEKAAENLLQPIEALKNAGFPVPKMLGNELKLIKEHGINVSDYAQERIKSLSSLHYQLTTDIIREVKGPHVWDKLPNMIAVKWQETVANEINEYKNKVDIRITSGEEVETNTSLDEGFLRLENLGGCIANDVEIQPIVHVKGLSTRDYKLPRIEPGPEHPARIEIKELLEINESFNANDVPLTIQVSWLVIGKEGNQRDYSPDPPSTRLKIVSDKEFIKKKLRQKWSEKHPYSFYYKAKYPKKFDDIAKEIDDMLHQERGLLFLEGEEGTGRSSLLISLAIHFWERGHEYHYVELKPETAHFSGWQEKCLSVFEQIAENTEIKDMNRRYNEPKSYIKELSSHLKNHILLLDLQQHLNMDDTVRLYPLLKGLSKYMTIVVPVDRNAAWQLRAIYSEQSFVDILSIGKEDQETFFKRYMGENGIKLLPEHWHFLVNNNIYSAFLLAKAIKQQGRKPGFEECVQWMLKAYENDEEYERVQYYQAVWESLTQAEQLIIYICAKEYSQIPINMLQEGMVMGKDPKMGKREHRPYSKDETGDALRDMKQDTILFKEDLDYIIKGAQARKLKDTAKENFSVKIHNAHTLMEYSEGYPRLLLANYQKDHSRLEGHLKHLQELRILKEYQVGEERYYAISDYIFMRFLLCRFDSYDKLLQNVDLIRIFHAEDIENAVSGMNDKERERFCGLLAINGEKLKSIREFANVWSSAKRDGKGIEKLFEFLKKLYWLNWLKQPEGSNNYNGFHEGHFKFQEPLTPHLESVLMYITREGEAGKALDLLNGYLNTAGLTDNKLVFLVPLSEARPYKLYPDWPKSKNLALIDEESILQCIRSGDRNIELLNQVSKYLNLRVLSPYKYKMQVWGHMFVGRSEELGLVLNHPEKNFSVVGERQIGKTSFLWKIKHEYQHINKKGVHPIFISWNDVYDEPEIYDQFSKNEDMKDLFGAGSVSRIRSVLDFQTTVKEFLNRKKGDRIVFLIDEVDGLIKNFKFPCPECRRDVIIRLGENNTPQCRKCGHWFSFDKIEEKERQKIPERKKVLRVFDTFRSLALEYPGRCQFVITGFALLHELHRDYHSAFLNFTERIDLELLKYPDARKLVLEPMRKLGVGFKDEAEVSEKIFRKSCGLPWGIQYFCNKIIEELSKSSNRTVDDQIISEVTPQVKRDIRDHLDYLLYERRWKSFYMLIEGYARESKADFSIEDLMTFQKNMDLKPEPMFTEREMKDILDFFAICFFMEKKDRYSDRYSINEEVFTDA